MSSAISAGDGLGLIYGSRQDAAETLRSQGGGFVLRLGGEDAPTLSVMGRHRVLMHLRLHVSEDSVTIPKAWIYDAAPPALAALRGKAIKKSDLRATLQRALPQPPAVDDDDDDLVDLVDLDDLDDDAFERSAPRAPRHGGRPVPSMPTHGAATGRSGVAPPRPPCSPHSMRDTSATQAPRVGSLTLAGLLAWEMAPDITPAEVAERHSAARRMRREATVDVTGELSLEHLELSHLTALTALPEGLGVSGYLHLTGCTGLITLPANLTVGSWLSLWNCTALTALPPHLTVGGWLDLQGCTALTALPADLTVARDLDLRGCRNLTTLPEEVLGWGPERWGGETVMRIIHLEGSGLSPDFLARLQQLQPQPEGIRFTYGRVAGAPSARPRRLPANRALT